MRACTLSYSLYICVMPQAFLVGLGGYVLWRVQKEPGGHLTGWWLYVRLTNQAPTASVVCFGCTDYAAVNSVPHLYVRGKTAKRDYLTMGHHLLKKFLAGWLFSIFPVPSYPRSPSPSIHRSSLKNSSPGLIAPGGALPPGPPPPPAPASGPSDPEPPVARRLPTTVPPPPQRLTVLQHWDGAEYGPEYLQLHSGDILLGPFVTDQEWVQAMQPRTGRQGWFPPDYAA